jgi:hypothetical protein
MTTYPVRRPASPHPVAIVPASGWTAYTSRSIYEESEKYPVVAFAVYEVDGAPHPAAIRPVIADSTRDRWLILAVDNARIVRDDTGEEVDSELNYRYYWPPGTVLKAAELDRIGVPIDASRVVATSALRTAGLEVGRTQVLRAALQYRRQGRVAGDSR